MKIYKLFTFSVIFQSLLMVSHQIEHKANIILGGSDSVVIFTLCKLSSSKAFKEVSLCFIKVACNHITNNVKCNIVPTRNLETISGTISGVVMKGRKHELCFYPVLCFYRYTV